MRDDFLFLTLSSKVSGSSFACFAEDSACFEILNGVRLEKVFSKNRLSFLVPFGKGEKPGKPNFASWSVGMFRHRLDLREIKHSQADEMRCVS